MTSERCDRRPRRSRPSSGARARRQRRRPRPLVELTEVAVLGLPARAARLDFCGGRLGGRRQLELGGVEGVCRQCWFGLISREHEYRLGRTIWVRAAAIPPCERLRFPPGRGVRSAVGEAPADFSAARQRPRLLPAAYVGDGNADSRQDGQVAGLGRIGRNPTCDVPKCHRIRRCEHALPRAGARAAPARTTAC